MKKTYNNILDAFKSVFGNKIDLNTTFDDLNPYKQISSNDDKAQQIYDMSKQIEKLLDKNTLLKKEMEEMQQSNDDSKRYRAKQGFSI